MNDEAGQIHKQFAHELFELVDRYHRQMREAGLLVQVRSIEVSCVDFPAGLTPIVDRVQPDVRILGGNS